MSADDREALQAEITRLRQQLDTVQHFGRLCVWERDLLTGRGRWDPQIFRLFGLPQQAESPGPEQAIALLHPLDKARALACWQASWARPGRHELRYRIQRPDGMVVYLHSIWEVPSVGALVRGVVIDDTESVQLAQAHEVTRTQLALVSKLVGMSLWRTDLATQRIFRGDQVWHATGIDPGEAGIPVTELRTLIHPDDLAAADRASRAVLDGHETADAETRYRTPDGGWRTMLTRRIAQRDAEGRPVAVLGVALDISEQAAERERYRRLLEQFDLVVEAAGVGLWTLDPATGAQHWNPAMRAIHGLGADEPIPDDDAQGVSNPVLPEDRPMLAELLRRLNSGQAQRVESTWHIRRPGGEVRTLVGRARRLGGEQPLVAGVAIDVTELHRAEQTARDKDTAERANRDKSAFLSRMSHELRTPLNAVLGFGALLLDDPREPPSPRQAERLQHVQRAGRHLLALIDDVLDLSRLESEAPDPAATTDLAVALKEVLPWIRPDAQAAGLLLDLQLPTAVVPGDARRWRQVLSNLLSNAVKYNRRGGQVVLSIQLLPGGQARLSVRDTGHGLDAAQRAQLFQPFNRLGAERSGIPGTGIGLTVVRRIVEGLGGHIDVQSTPGVGTEVTLLLPLAAAPPPSGAQVDAACGPPAAPTGRHDLVYVEDNPVNLLLLQQALAPHTAWHLHGATTVAEGEAMVRRLRPSLVLVDLHLPDGDGYTLLQRLRSGPEPATAPCVVLSADAQPEQIQRALAAGFEDYWTKPVDTVAVVAAIGRRLAGPAGSAGPTGP
ncbi:MAG: PAS domain-containing protein, partial [Rubrivivax sp.]|nr:PAS domain-containing protein [Rubrivivax sp.]